MASYDMGSQGASEDPEALADVLERQLRSDPLPADDERLFAPVAAARGGAIVRFLKKCLRVFGRRSDQDLPTADMAAQGAPEHA